MVTFASGSTLATLLLCYRVSALLKVISSPEKKRSRELLHFIRMYESSSFNRPVTPARSSHQCKRTRPVCDLREEAGKDLIKSLQIN